MHTPLIMHEQRLEPIRHSRSVEREKRTLSLVPKLVDDSLVIGFQGREKKRDAH